MIKKRNYREDDYNLIMDFLREIYKQKGEQYCWLPQRWEYAEYHCNPLFMGRGWEDWRNYIQLWEEDGKIVAIAHKESCQDVFVQVRPGYEFLGGEMLDYLENTVPFESKNKTNTIELSINNSKRWMEPLLMERGYVKSKDCIYYNVTDVSGKYEPKLPSGFKFVDATIIKDERKRAVCCYLGFHPDDEKKDHSKFPDLGMEKAQLFNPKLELMVQDREGNLCSFSGFWYDPILEIGMVEPVCTRKKYRLKGLGKQMLIEGLRRLKELGAKKVYVESYGDNRKSFYNKAGFETYDADYFWKKSFK